MSSILRALKKLEIETPQRIDLSLAEKINIKKSINKGVKRTWLFGRLLSLVLVVAIMALGGWFFFYQRPLLIKGLFSGVKSLNVEKKESGMSSIPVQKTSEMTMTMVGERKAPGALPVKLTENVVNRPVQPPKRRSRIKNLEKSHDFTGKDRQSMIIEQPVPLKKAGESTLKLQAIAWSSDPKERIAVINGFVVREGDAIGGSTVSHIGAEVVVVREGEAERNLVFKHK